MHHRYYTNEMYYDFIDAPLTNKEILSIDFFAGVHNKPYKLPPSRMNADQQIIYAYLKDMSDDYDADEGWSASHWIEKHDIYKIIMALFPERTTCRSKIWEMFYRFMLPTLLRKADIPVLYWKLMHECSERDVLFMMCKIHTHTGESIMRKKERKLKCQKRPKY